MANKARDAKGRFISPDGEGVKRKEDRLYRVWCAIKERCENKNNKSYKNYGGRGISICEEWKNDYPAFKKWSIDNGYKNDLTIDRIDYNGNYEPKNCRWATTKEQNRNYRRNRFLYIDNKRYCVKEVSEMYDIPYGRLLWRLKNGYSLEMALDKGDRRYGK